MIALNVRSSLLEGTGIISREGSRAHERKGLVLFDRVSLHIALGNSGCSGDKTVEIEYMRILNKVLPKDIRVLSCAPVHPDFSARLLLFY